MKKLFVLLALISFFACKKSTTHPTTNNNTTPPPATMNIEFFVNANKHQIREPFDYPSGSPMFSDASPFTGLASGDVCTTQGKSLTVKYSTSDTTTYTIWFYTAATPTDIYRGTAELKITKAGSIILGYSSFAGAASAGCVKAIIME